jgi:hypothetical protein
LSRKSRRIITICSRSIIEVRLRLKEILEYEQYCSTYGNLVSMRFFLAGIKKRTMTAERVYHTKGLNLLRTAVAELRGEQRESAVAPEVILATAIKLFEKSGDQMNVRIAKQWMKLAEEKQAQDLVGA